MFFSAPVSSPRLRFFLHVNPNDKMPRANAQKCLQPSRTLKATICRATPTAEKALGIIDHGGLYKLNKFPGQAMLASLFFICTSAMAQAPGKPVIALLAAVGDQVSISRQKSGTGSHLEPVDRGVLPIAGQALNLTLLRGLDRAIESVEPDAERVLLVWEPDAAMRQKLDDSWGAKRDAMLLQALIDHLRPIPDRRQWTRIEALLPKYVSFERKGMGTKLGGIGVYVQPLASMSIQFLDSGITQLPGDTPGPDRTINPRTGETGNASTYVAPYLYFERITIDAASLTVLSRKPQFDNVKYHDPDSQSADVGRHLPGEMLAEKLLELAEKSAYQSVAGKIDVQVTAPRPLPAASAAKP